MDAEEGYIMLFYREAEEREREACASVADKLAALYSGQSATHQLIRGTAKKIAERIRARGKQ